MNAIADDAFPSLRGRKAASVDTHPELARRLLWRAFQQGRMDERELASTLDRLEPPPDGGGRLAAPGVVHVLLALDQPMLGQFAKLTLDHGRFETRSVDRGSEVEAVFANWRPHLVLLSMDSDGLVFMDQIRSMGARRGRLPVVGLTRRGDLKSKLAAFESGVDDLVTIPFAPEELLARVLAVVRRSYGEAVPFTPAITIGGLEIDILNRTVRTGSSELRLTSLEQSLLYLLAANAGRVVSREEILDALWGAEYVAESNVVDRQIRNLRAQLQDDWKRPRFIATVPGRGYRFLARTSVSRGSGS